MSKLYLLLSICIFCSCVATKQIEPEKFTSQLAQHASHVVDKCVLTFGLLPIVELDTVTLSQDGPYLKLMIRLDECKMDGLGLIYDSQTYFDSYFNGACLDSMSLIPVVQTLNEEFIDYSFSIDELDFGEVQRFIFDFEVVKCKKGSIYTVPGGAYWFDVENEFIVDKSRIYVTFED